MPLKLRNLAVVPLLGTALALTACSQGGNDDIDRVTPSATGESAGASGAERSANDSDTSADRPSPEEISAVLEEQTEGAFDSLTPEQQDTFYTCLGKGLYDSEVPDEALVDLVTGGSGSSNDAESDEYAKITEDLSIECAKTLR